MNEMTKNDEARNPMSLAVASAAFGSFGAQEWPEIPGVIKVEASEGRMTVHFADGVTATVERCPIGRMAGRDHYNVFLPPHAGDPEAISARMVPSLTPAEVVALLTKTAAAAR